MLLCRGGPVKPINRDPITTIIGRVKKNLESRPRLHGTWIVSVGLRANRPTRSNRAAANASPPPAMVTSAPIFIWSRSGPSGMTAAAKNKAKTSPIEAVHPTTRSSRQPTRAGRCRPAAIAPPAAATMPIGRASAAIGIAQKPTSRPWSGTPALTNPNRKSTPSTGRRHQRSKSVSVS